MNQRSDPMHLTNMSAKRFSSVSKNHSKDRKVVHTHVQSMTSAKKTLATAAVQTNLMNDYLE